MYIGQYLPAGAVLYSPWFPREADNAYFTFETIDKDTSGSPDLTVAVFHKNTDEQGPGSSASASFSTLSGAFEQAQVTGLREMVRFKFTVTGSWVIFRMLPPSWFDSRVPTA